jgi:hypothetical protein
MGLSKYCTERQTLRLLLSLRSSNLLLRNPRPLAILISIRRCGIYSCVFLSLEVVSWGNQPSLQQTLGTYTYFRRATSISSISSTFDTSSILLLPATTYDIGIHCGNNAHSDEVRQSTRTECLIALNLTAFVQSD